MIGINKCGRALDASSCAGIHQLSSSQLIHQSPLLQPSPHSHALAPMGRRPFGTPEQMVFMRGRLPDMEREKEENGLTPFYNTTAALFLERWPAQVTEKDREETKTEQEALQRAIQRRTDVSSFGLCHE